MKDSSLIYKESFFYFLGSIVVAVMGFIISLLYSYFFNPSDYGTHSLASSTYMLLSQFFGLWLSTSVLRFNENYRRKGKSNTFLTTIYLTQFILSIAFILILNLGSLIISHDLNFKIIFLIYTFIYFFEYNILIFNSTLRANNYVRKYNINITFNNFLKIIILLFLIFALQIKSIYVISISILFTEAIQFIYFFIKNNMYRYFNKNNYDLNILKQVFIYTFPLIGTTITSWILNVSDRYVIRILRNSYEVGLYSYAYLLGNNLFWLLANFIMLGAFPNFVKTFEKKDYHKLKDLFSKYINLYFLIIIPACFGVIGTSKTLFSAITSPMYHESYVVFILTSIGISIFGLCQFTNKVFELYKKTKTILILNVISAIFNIIFNFIFIYYIGYVGGAISTLLSYILYFILSLYFSRKLFKFNWNLKLAFKYIISATFMLFIIMLEEQNLNINLLIIKLIIEILSGIIIYILSLFVVGGLNKKKLEGILLLLKRNK